MTVLEILKNASYYLNLDEDFAPYFDSDSNTTASSQVAHEWEKMLISFNSLIKSIATQRIPVIKEEDIIFNSDGEFNLNTLSETFHSVQRIVGFSGLLFASSTNDGKLKSNYCGPARLRYSYIPDDYATTDSLDIYKNVLNDKVLSYGVCYIYCEMSALYDDSDMWKEKYESSINDCMSVQVQNMVIKTRRWL